MAGTVRKILPRETDNVSPSRLINKIIRMRGVFPRGPVYDLAKRKSRNSGWLLIWIRVEICPHLYETEWPAFNNTKTHEIHARSRILSCPR